MSESFNTKSVRNYGILITLFVIAFLFRECQHQKQVDNLIVSVADYKDTAYYYKAENGKVVAYNDALELQNEDQIKAILKKDEDFRLLLEGFKNINATGGVTTIFRVEHDTIKLTDTIPCDFEPILVERLTTEYNFNGTITPTNFIIDSLTIPNEMKFVVGEKKIGLFKKEKRIEVVNSNPLIQTTGITAYVVEEKKNGLKFVLISIGGAIVGIITERLIVKH